MNDPTQQTPAEAKSWARVENELAAMRATVSKAIGLHDRNLELAEENRQIKADNAALRAALKDIAAHYRSSQANCEIARAALGKEGEK